MDKRKSLLVLGSIVIISFIYFVFATIYVQPATFTVNEDVQNIFNITINNSGGDTLNNITQVNITSLNESTFVYIANSNASRNNATSYTFSNTSTVLSWNSSNIYLINGSSNGSWFLFNASVATPGVYTLEIMTLNGTGGSTRNNITVTVNDTTVPEVVMANISSPTTGSNKSGTLLLNVSIYDNGPMGAVFFNITNSSGSQNATFNAVQAGSSWSNSSVPTTSFPNGIYNITVHANDTNNNINKSALVYNVIFDNTAPSITISSSSATRSSLTISISATDALSGLNGSCSSDRSGATITGTSSLTESSLSCGTSYAYIVTCYDRAAKSGSSTSTSFSTSACDSGSASSGTTTSTWTNTYTTTNEQIVAGYTKELAVKNRVKLKISNEDHYVGVKELTTTTAKVEISSTPQEATLNIGDTKKFDVTDDNTYDLSVTLNGIANNKADLTIKSISEEVTSASEEDQEAGESPIGETGGVNPLDELEGNNWLWIVLGIVVLAIVIGAGIAMKKKK